jgi:hypothetical protein
MSKRMYAFDPKADKEIPVGVLHDDGTFVAIAKTKLALPPAWAIAQEAITDLLEAKAHTLIFQDKDGGRWQTSMERFMEKKFPVHRGGHEKQWGMILSEFQSDFQTEGEGGWK